MSVNIADQLLIIMSGMDIINLICFRADLKLTMKYINSVKNPNISKTMTTAFLTRDNKGSVHSVHDVGTCHRTIHFTNTFKEL